MKINWILPEVTKSGGVKVALEYANLLTDRGHDVVVYSPLSGQHWGWKRIFFIKDVIKIKNNPNFKGAWFRNRFKFEFPVWINNKSIRDADVTIATSWITSYWVDNLSHIKGKKVYFIQDFETWGNKNTNDIVLNSYKLTFDKRITVSTALHDRLLNECDADSEVVCNGIEEIFLKDLGDKKTDQITLGLPFREIRGDDVKNCEFGLQVLKRIKELYKDVKLVSFGFKKPQQWDDTISFLENPTQDELIKLYHDVNIFYVPSIYEGWGLPAMEAMAQSCCVLATNTGLIKEIGKDDENCIIINNPKDFEEITSKIKSVMNDKYKCLIIGKNAKQTISNLTQDKSVIRFENILKELIEQ